MELYKEISPYLRVAFYHKASFVMKPRIIFDYELLYLEKGQMLIDIEGSKYKLEPGQLLLLKPGIEHTIRTLGDELAWMPHIHFDLKEDDKSSEVPINFKTLDQCDELEKSYIRTDLLSEPPFDFPPVIVLNHHKEIKSLIIQLIKIYNRKLPEEELLSKSLVIQILYEIHKGLSQERENDLYLHNDAIEDTAEFMLKNYEKNITVEELAKQACLSVFYYQRLFKKKYSVTPHDYLIRHRIEKAKELMVYTPMSLSEIGRVIGYKQMSSFSKVFKNKEGMSPRDYRKRMTS